jgi:hypothetical protein
MPKKCKSVFKSSGIDIRENCLTTEEMNMIQLELEEEQAQSYADEYGRIGQLIQAERN